MISIHNFALLWRKLFKLSKTLELDYKGEKVVTGMLVKEKEDYEFFKRYFDNNWLQVCKLQKSREDYPCSYS